MHFQVVLVLVLALTTLLEKGDAACINCGLGEGKDVCINGDNCSPMIIRPVRLQKYDPGEFLKPRVVCKQIGGLTPLKPVGDLCSCKKAIVTPAIVPKPPRALCGNTECQTHSSSSSSSSSTSSSSASSSSIGYSGSSSSGTYGGSSSSNYGGSSSSNYGGSSSSNYGGSSSSNYGGLSSSNCGGSSSVSCDGSSGIISSNPSYIVKEEYVDISNTPADPVSLSLAYNLRNKVHSISEDKLAYGFRTLPKEVKVAKKIKVIPEEHLYGLNGQVVELKPIAIANSKSVDEEAYDELLQEQMNEEIAEEIPEVKHLTYKEIGFGPSKYETVPYVAVQGTGEVQTQGSCSENCQDGFVPGNVIIKSVPKTNVYISEQPVVTLERNEELGGVPYPVYSYSSSSSSASSSSNNYNAQKLVFEKLECD